MFTDDDLIPISALQHYVFCPRQWGLIHLEKVWNENRFTAEGRILHDKTHDADTENRADLRIARGLRLCSYRLGLTGQADVVEFHKADKGVVLEKVEGFWMPIPVEYKRGKPKIGICDEVQICAQAMCLEEMLKTTIESGSIFYGTPRRRTQIIFTDTLRQQTESLIIELHDLISNGITPKADYGKKCESCSLIETCMPKITGINKDIAHYLLKAKNLEIEGSDETSA